MQKNLIDKEYLKVMERFRDLLWTYKRSGEKFKDLAQQAGVSQGSITKFMHGENIYFSTAWKILRVLLQRDPISFESNEEMEKLRQFRDQLKNMFK